jgi:hypothetical protein
MICRLLKSLLIIPGVTLSCTMTVQICSIDIQDNANKMCHVNISLPNLYYTFQSIVYSCKCHSIFVLINLELNTNFTFGTNCQIGENKHILYFLRKCIKIAIQVRKLVRINLFLAKCSLIDQWFVGKPCARCMASTKFDIFAYIHRRLW